MYGSEGGHLELGCEGGDAAFCVLTKLACHVVLVVFSGAGAGECGEGWCEMHTAEAGCTGRIDVFSLQSGSVGRVRAKRADEFGCVEWRRMLQFGV